MGAHRVSQNWMLILSASKQTKRAKQRFNCMSLASGLQKLVRIEAIKLEKKLTAVFETRVTLVPPPFAHALFEAQIFKYEQDLKENK